MSDSSIVSGSKKLSVFASLLMLLGVATSTVAPSAGAQPAPTPPPVSLERMGPPPEGSNDWNCRPSNDHPRPVILIHGTDTDMQESWPTLSPELAAQGYCVFALNYGAIPLWDYSRLVWGVGDIAKSAGELEEFVNTVLQRTAASQVDLVGHSQGGTMARQYLRFNGGADAGDSANSKVHRLITLGGTNHGTSFNGLQQMYLTAVSLGLPREIISQFIFGLAGSQQLIGSPMLKKLNAGNEVMAGVDYTVIATRNDKVVTPPERTFLDDHGSGQVTNQWVQDLCPANQTSHMGLTRDPVVAYMVSTALDPSYPDTHPVVCAEPA